MVAVMDLQKEREAFEAYMAEKYKNLMDRRQCRNNGGGYMSWDMNVAWQVWQAAKAHEEKKLEGCVVVQSKGLILTCEEILEVLQFGAPDLKIERTEYSEEQMSTEITIVHRDTGHCGAGIYAYCTDCPEEGAIKLGDIEAARGGTYEGVVLEPKSDTEGN